MLLRPYRLNQEIVAWHEAGHAAAIEALGEHWFEAHLDSDALSGFVSWSPSKSDQPATFDATTAPRVVIGTSPVLKAISRKSAIQFFAGVAAERIHLGLPFDPEAFADPDFHDFAFARWMLSLTDSESDACYCARVAYDLAIIFKSRIAYLADCLLADGRICYQEVQLP